VPVEKKKKRDLVSRLPVSAINANFMVNGSRLIG
jgi:hypothetical protein